MKVRHVFHICDHIQTISTQINPLTSADAKNKSKDIHLPSIDVNFASNRILYDNPFIHGMLRAEKLLLGLAQVLRLHMVGGMDSSAVTVSESPPFYGTSPCVKFPFLLTSPFSSSNRR